MKGVHINFDVPSYQRLPLGLCLVSERSYHKLPAADVELTTIEETPLEPVKINRLRPSAKTVAPVDLTSSDMGPVSEEDIRAEFIPLDAYQDSREAENEKKPVDDFSEINFAGKPGGSVSGEYNGSGFAHYRFNKKNGKSFYLRVGKHLIWGIELRRELDRLKPKQGREIRVTFLGKQPVTVLKKINGQDEWVNTHRNSWQIEMI